MSRGSGELRPSPTLISNGSGPISWNAIGAKLHGLIRNQGEERLLLFDTGWRSEYGCHVDPSTRGPNDSDVRRPWPHPEAVLLSRGPFDFPPDIPPPQGAELLRSGKIHRINGDGNFSLNLAGTVAPIFVALVKVPISHIGTASYGVLSIVWILLGYFGFLDLGVSRVSANALARIGHSSRKQGGKVLIAAFCLCLCLGLISGFVLYFACSFLLEHVVAVPADLKRKLPTHFRASPAFSAARDSWWAEERWLENRRAFVIDSESAIRYSDKS
jgi:hypothetical protein